MTYVTDTIKRNEIAQKIQQALDRRQPTNYRIIVDEEAITEDSDWYQIVVRTENDVRDNDFYFTLAEVEQELHDADPNGREYLLVPALTD